MLCFEPLPKRSGTARHDPVRSDLGGGRERLALSQLKNVVQVKVWTDPVRKNLERTISDWDRPPNQICTPKARVAVGLALAFLSDELSELGR